MKLLELHKTLSLQLPYRSNVITKKPEKHVHEPVVVCINHYEYTKVWLLRTGMLYYFTSVLILLHVKPKPAFHK